MAQINNLTAYKGEDIIIPFIMTPVEDITGWDLLFTLKVRSTDPSPLFTVTPSIPTGIDGRFRVTIPSADLLIPARAYYYDVWRRDSGSARVLSIGSFTVLQEVRVP